MKLFCKQAQSIPTGTGDAAYGHLRLEMQGLYFSIRQLPAMCAWGSTATSFTAEKSS